VGIPLTHVQTTGIHGTMICMNTVNISPLILMPRSLFLRLHAAYPGAAQGCNGCSARHKEARCTPAPWSERKGLQKATRGRFVAECRSAHTVECACLTASQDLSTEEATGPLAQTTLRSRDVASTGGAPWAGSAHPRSSFSCLRRTAARVPWSASMALRCLSASRDRMQKRFRAMGDVGEMCLAAVSTNLGEALVISGRGMRSLNPTLVVSLRSAHKQRDRPAARKTPIGGRNGNVPGARCAEGQCVGCVT
jgi:hypothetical protein